SGCFDGSSSSSSRSQVQTGTFVDSPVAGLDYEGDRTRASRTDEAGRFEYRRGEALRFAIGELELGSATGAEVLTPLSITADATDAQDQRVTNKLILLQTLDADGDLNNGIQITDAIRSRVSAQAADIRFDQPPEQFRDSIAELIAALEADARHQTLAVSVAQCADSMPTSAAGSSSAFPMPSRRSATCSGARRSRARPGPGYARQWPGPTSPHRTWRWSGSMKGA